MQDDEVLVEFQSGWCKFLLYFIYYFLILFPILIGVYSFYSYNLFIAFSMFLASLFFTLIIMSKIRNDAIPPKQRELNYSNLNIIRWYLKRNLICQ